MIIKKRVLFLLLALLFLPQVLALEISDAKLTWGNRTVLYYSDNTRITVNLELTISSSNLDNVMLDISDLNNAFTYTSLTDHYESISVSEASCDSVEEDKFECILRNVILRKSEPEITILATKGTETSSTSLTLQRTNANPRVTFIGTENCHDNKCYSTPGITSLLLEFENSDAGFHRGMISFSALGSSGSVYGCGSTSCEGVINLQCTEGQEVFVSLSPYRGRPSADDAGRQITRQSFSIICDANPPVIEGIKVVDARDIGITEISDSFRIIANVSDSVSPVMNMKVIGDNINANNVTGECVLRENVFHCSASVAAAVPGRGYYDVPVIFFDLAGNEVRKVLNVQLVEIDKDETPNFWGVGNVVQSTDSFSLRNMGYEREVFIEVPFTGSATLLKASLPSSACRPVQENITGRKSDIKSLSVLRTDSSQSKVYLKVVFRETGLSVKNENHRYSDYDGLEYECDLELYSMMNNFFYSIPELKTFNMKFDLKEGYALDDEIYNRLESLNKRIEDTDKRLEGREKIMNTVDLFCRGVLALDAGKGASATAQLALAALGVTKPVSEIMMKVTDVLDEADSALVNFGLTACEVATCKLVDKLTEPLTDAIGMDNIAEAIGAETPQIFNPYKSEIIARATMCYPAILYHERVKQGIDCNYADCLSRGVTEMGFTVKHCEISKSYDDCLRKSGNIIYMVPFTSMFTDLAQDFSNIVGDPAALMGGAVSLTCKILSLTGTSTLHGTCVVAQTAMSLPTHYERAVGLIEQMELVLGLSNPVRDRCEPAVHSVSAALKMKFEDDARMSAFSLLPDHFGDEVTSEKTLSDGRALRCAGSDCFIFESDAEDAKLTSRTSTGIDSITIVYDENGKKLAEGKFIGGEIEFEEELSGEERLELFDGVMQSQEHTNMYYNYYESNYPDAYNYAMTANDIRADRADRLTQEASRRDEVSGFFAVYGHSNVGRRTTLQDLYDDYSYLPSGQDYAEIDGDKFYEDFGVTWDEFYGAVETANPGAFDNPEDVNFRNLNKDVNEHVDEQGALADMGENLREAFNDFMTKASEQFVDTSTVALVRQGARGMSSAADLFGWDDRRWSEDTAAGRLSEWIDINIAQPERAFCDARITSVDDPVSGGTGAVVSKTAGGTFPGAFINFRRTSLHEPAGEDPYYYYYVEGGINTNRPGLRYKLYAYDASGNRHDFTERITRQEFPQVGDSGSSSFGGFGDATRLKSELDLDRVCIYFDTNRLSDYFHIVSLSGNELCQKVIGE